MAQKQLFKLEIDLIPKTCWYSNLRKEMPQSRWDKLRREVLESADHACEICGARGKLNCHEVWEYDDDKQVQKLVGFQAICNLCHHVKHFGRAKLLAAEGYLDLEAVIEHFKAVNGVGDREFKSHRHQAFRVWTERTHREWRTDFGKFECLVQSQK
jgi:hypothetical protein